MINSSGNSTYGTVIAIAFQFFARIYTRIYFDLIIFHKANNTTNKGTITIRSDIYHTYTF